MTVCVSLFWLLFYEWQLMVFRGFIFYLDCLFVKIWFNFYDHLFKRNGQSSQLDRFFYIQRNKSNNIILKLHKLRVITFEKVLQGSILQYMIKNRIKFIFFTQMGSRTCAINLLSVYLICSLFLNIYWNLYSQKVYNKKVTVEKKWLLTIEKKRYDQNEKEDTRLQVAHFK